MTSLFSPSSFCYHTLMSGVDPRTMQKWDERIIRRLTAIRKACLAIRLCEVMHAKSAPYSAPYMGQARQDYVLGCIDKLSNGVYYCAKNPIR